MKIAIYTIAKNEEKHVERWYESTKDADYHIIADTGSTDKTVEIAESLGIKVGHIKVMPWRFDDARNASLAMIPEDADYCIALDMDEVLTPNWRKYLELAHKAGVDRPVYRRIESFNEDGTVASEFDGFKVHRRNGIRWHYPIHEVPYWYYTKPEDAVRIDGFEVHHLQDKTKSRTQYLSLLEMAVQENPDARNLYYLGREQTNFQQYKEATETLKKYLELSVFKQERAAACRLLCKADPDNAEEWLMKGTEEYPSRESILALANYYYMKQQWAETHLVAKEALEYNTRPTEFLSEGWAWGHMAHDLVAVSAWQLQDYKTALEHGLKALEISPDDERLQKNVTFYKEKLNGNTKRDGK